MDKTDKLLFFNKEGYPYNFQYNDIDKKWEGKLIFDENSDGLFKTLGLYLFEKVDSIKISNYFDFEQSQLFNYSGMTFISKTYENQIVEDIKRVNESPLFYTKWIYGKDFDIKFKPGSVITFNFEGEWFSESEWDDFNGEDVYFNVIGSKKNAILIETITQNSSFINFDFKTGVTISSHNIIKVPDYGNLNLVDINNLDYYNGKKLSIVNSTYNDKIVTYEDYSILRNKVYDFELTPEISGTLKINLTLFSQRPKIYTGPLSIDITDNTTKGTEITFYNDINNDIQFLNTGQTIIFEDYNGNGIFPYNPTFTITGYKNREFIITSGMTFIEWEDRNFIFIEGISNLTGISFNDIIELESNPFVENKTLHNKRKFDIVKVFEKDPTNTNEGITIEVEQYVSNESGYTYDLYKSFRKSQVQTIYAEQSVYNSNTGITTDAICLSTTNKINIEQEILLSGNTDHYYDNTIESVRIKYNDYLNNYGIDIYNYFYLGKSYLMVEGLYDYNYNPYFYVDAYINETPLTVGNNFVYPTGFTNSDTDVFYFDVKEQLLDEKINLYDYNKLSRNFNYEIYMNLTNDLINYGFKITLDGVEYFINFKDDTQGTINNWISKYGDIFNKIGFDVYSGYTNEYNGYTLNINGKYPNIEVLDIDIFVNTYSEYKIIDKQDNKGIVISSNQLRSIYTNLYDLGLSTGMVISVNGSKYPLNNKEYNIISVTEDKLQLSYQGPFFYEYITGVTFIDLEVRDFIRKPRSYYNKKVEYKASWVEPETGEIDDDLFLYDFSGNQLKPYNNIYGLTYVGEIPLYNENSDDKVFLNREPNKSDSEINNPSAQQTIFDDITYELENLDDSDSYNYIPEPMEFYLGFYSDSEGVSSNELKIEKIEYSYLSGITNYDDGDKKQFLISGNIIQFEIDDYLFDFSDYGFEVGQIINLDLIDTDKTGQTIYDNYNDYRIKNITRTKIFIDTDFSDGLNYFNTSEMSGKTFYFELKTVPKEILRAKVYGQSEIEDERLDINIRNQGIDIYKEAEFIFKESDIKEHSVDYIRLNRKRKEMMSIYTDIFNYIGSYKSLIHAIDFFGYNDLKLYEYYRNIKTDSPLYGKLQKIIIPDIFDNAIDGWSFDDLIKDKYDKGYYKKTNLFNLTYRITDEFGNYSLQYSLEEVQIKLMALVRWLRKNIIPLSSNIRDITGVADTIHDIQLRHNSAYWVTKSTVDESSVGVNFYYTATKTQQKNYIFTINFYILDGHEKPDYFTVKIKTFKLDDKTNELIPQSNNLLYKTDYEPYTFNLNSDIDPYISIETETSNGYGAGYNNSKMFKYDVMKNYYLVNSNFNSTSFPYLNREDGYYIIDDGRFFIIKS